MDAELELDSLLEDYLVAIDHYSLAQAALAANLKSVRHLVPRTVDDAPLTPPGPLGTL